MTDVRIPLPPDVSLVETPFEHVTVREFHQGSNGRLIVHIQDAHSNLSGQRHLAGALDRMVRRYGISTVLVEGSEGDVTLDEFRRIGSPELWKRAANRLLYEGIVSGEEYLNLTSGHPIRLVGVEDQKLYDESLATYERLVRSRAVVSGYLKRIRDTAARIKARAYPPELLGYESALASAPDDLNRRASALFDLADRAGVALGAEFPNCAALVSLRKKEALVDFELVRRDQDRLLEAALTGESPEAREAAVAAGRRAAGQPIAVESWLRELLEAAVRKGGSAASYPVLEMYRHYLSEFARLRMDLLLEELDRLEDRAYRVILASDEDARMVRACDRFLGLLEKAHQIRMSSGEFAALRINEADFPTEPMLAFLNRRLLDSGYVEDLMEYRTCVEAARADLERFYELVDRRDLAFMRGTERAFGDSGRNSPAAAFLIAGGYHTDHLTRLWRDAGYSYLVLTPVVEFETDHRQYEKLLLAPLKSARRPSGRGPDGAKRSAVKIARSQVSATTDGLRKTNFVRSVLSDPGGARMALGAFSSDDARRILDLAAARAVSSAAGSRMADEASTQADPDPPSISWQPSAADRQAVQRFSVRGPILDLRPISGGGQVDVYEGKFGFDKDRMRTRPVAVVFPKRIESAPRFALSLARTLTELRNDDVGVPALIGIQLEADAYLRKDLVGVPGFSSPRGRTAVIMELMPEEGFSSDDAEFDGRISRIAPYDRLFIAQAVARTLQWVHSRRYIHGDVKPSNIFIDPWLFGPERSEANRPRHLARLVDYGSAVNFGESAQNAQSIAWTPNLLPLPDDLIDRYRTARASERQEAVDAVLAEMQEFMKGKWGPETDWYAFAVVFARLMGHDLNTFTGNGPFEERKKAFLDELEGADYGLYLVMRDLLDKDRFDPRRSLADYRLTEEQRGGILSGIERMIFVGTASVDPFHRASAIQLFAGPDDETVQADPKDAGARMADGRKNVPKSYRLIEPVLGDIARHLLHMAGSAMGIDEARLDEIEDDFEIRLHSDASVGTSYIDEEGNISIYDRAFYMKAWMGSEEADSGAADAAVLDADSEVVREVYSHVASEIGHLIHIRMGYDSRRTNLFGNPIAHIAVQEAYDTGVSAWTDTIFGGDPEAVLSRLRYSARIGELFLIYLRSQGISVHDDLMLEAEEEFDRLMTQPSSDRTAEPGLVQGFLNFLASNGVGIDDLRSAVSDGTYAMMHFVGTYAYVRILDTVGGDHALALQKMGTALAKKRYSWLFSDPVRFAKWVGRIRVRDGIDYRRRVEKSLQHVRDPGMSAALLVRSRRLIERLAQRPDAPVSDPQTRNVMLGMVVQAAEHLIKGLEEKLEREREKLGSMTENIQNMNQGGGPRGAVPFGRRLLAWSSVLALALVPFVTGLASYQLAERWLGETPFYNHPWISAVGAVVWLIGSMSLTLWTWTRLRQWPIASRTGPFERSARGGPDGVDRSGPRPRGPYTSSAGSRMSGSAASVGVDGFTARTLEAIRQEYLAPDYPAEGERLDPARLGRALNRYERFVRDMAASAATPIQVLNRPLSIREFWRASLSDIRASFRSLLFGEQRKTALVNIAGNLIFLGVQLYPPFAVHTVDGDGRIGIVYQSDRARMYATSLLWLLAGFADPMTAPMAVVSIGVIWAFSRLPVRSTGHELTHVLQMVIAERFRQEFHPRVDPARFMDAISVVALQDPVHRYEKTVRSSDGRISAPLRMAPPSLERLNVIAQEIVRDAARAAEQMTASSGARMAPSVEAVRRVLESGEAVPEAGGQEKVLYDLGAGYVALVSAVPELNDMVRNEYEILNELNPPSSEDPRDDLPVAFGSGTAEIQGSARTFMIMRRFSEGESLEERLLREGITDEEALRVLASVARTLAYVASRGVIHRDVKPANVHIGRDGSVVLHDFSVSVRIPPADGSKEGDRLEVFRAEEASLKRGEMPITGSIDHKPYGTIWAAQKIPGVSRQMLHSPALDLYAYGRMIMDLYPDWRAMPEEFRNLVRSLAPVTADMRDMTIRSWEEIVSQIDQAAERYGSEAFRHSGIHLVPEEVQDWQVRQYLSQSEERLRERLQTWLDPGAPGVTDFDLTQEDRSLRRRIVQDLGRMSERVRLAGLLIQLARSFRALEDARENENVALVDRLRERTLRQLRRADRVSLRVTGIESVRTLLTRARLGVEEAGTGSGSRMAGEAVREGLEELVHENLGQRVGSFFVPGEGANPIRRSQNGRVFALRGRFVAVMDRIDLKGSPEAIEASARAQVEELRAWIPASVPSERVLLVYPTDEVQRQDFNAYTASMMLQMSRYDGDFKDAQVLGAGSGAGALELLALSLGAKKAVLTDLDPQLLAVARGVMSGNGIASHRFTTAVLDLTDPAAREAVIGRELDPQVPTIGIANIGRWETIDYGRANIEAVRMFVSWSGTQVVFNGGYLPLQSISKRELDVSNGERKEVEAVLAASGFAHRFLAPDDEDDVREYDRPVLIAWKPSGSRMADERTAAVRFMDFYQLTAGLPRKAADPDALDAASVGRARESLSGVNRVLKGVPVALGAYYVDAVELVSLRAEQEAADYANGLDAVLGRLLRFVGRQAKGTEKPADVLIRHRGSLRPSFDAEGIARLNELAGLYAKLGIYFAFDSPVEGFEGIRPAVSSNIRTVSGARLSESSLLVENEGAFLVQMSEGDAFYDFALNALAMAAIARSDDGSMAEVLSEVAPALRKLTGKRLEDLAPADLLAMKSYSVSGEASLRRMALRAFPLVNEIVAAARMAVQAVRSAA